MTRAELQYYLDENFPDLVDDPGYTIAVNAGGTMDKLTITSVTLDSSRANSTELDATSFTTSVTSFIADNPVPSKYDDLSTTGSTPFE